MCSTLYLVPNSENKPPTAYCISGNVLCRLAFADKIPGKLLTYHKDNIQLVISDTGIGIPKNELYEIFEPFTVSSRTKTPAGGRGLGLAICKRILEVHNGTVTAESDGGKGATFKAVLRG